MELFEIVMKLSGPVQPCGDHHKDAWRLKNIRQITELVDKLLFEIGKASLQANQPEHSISAIGVHAADFLRDVRDCDAECKSNCLKHND